LTELARRNGGRLPLGVRADTEPASIPISVQDTTRTTFWIEPQTARVVDVESVQTSTTTAQLSIGPVLLAGTPIATSGWPASAVTAAVEQARADVSAIDRHGLVIGNAVAFGVVAVVAWAVGLGLLLAGSRYRRGLVTAPDSTAEPVRG
jgi:hypothetical protein